MRTTCLALVAAISMSSVCSLRILENQAPEETEDEELDFVHPVIDLINNQESNDEIKRLEHRPPRSGVDRNQQEAAAEADVEYEQIDESPMVNVTASIYVVNLAKRKDRWACAEAQLARSPYPYQRFEAVSTQTVDEECPYLKHAHQGGGGPAKGILCSNYRIWEKEVNGTSDFIIIFEDDIVMGTHIWERVQDLLSGPCSGKFDYLVVDTFSGQGIERQAVKATAGGKGEFCPNAAGSIGLHHNRGAGAQMQIVRRSVVQRLMDLALEKPSMPIDMVNKHLFNDAHKIRGGMFQAKIAAQYKSAVAQNVHPHLPDSCKKSVGKVDIHGR